MICNLVTGGGALVDMLPFLKLIGIFIHIYQYVLSVTNDWYIKVPTFENVPICKHVQIHANGTSLEIGTLYSRNPSNFYEKQVISTFLKDRYI